MNWHNQSIKKPRILRCHGQPHGCRSLQWWRKPLNTWAHRIQPECDLAASPETNSSKFDRPPGEASQARSSSSGPVGSEHVGTFHWLIAFDRRWMNCCVIVFLRMLPGPNKTSTYSFRSSFGSESVGIEACSWLPQQDQMLELQLPLRGSRSGQVVRHAIEAVERIHQKQSPMVYKRGFTHCPVSRFRNQKYESIVDPHQKWEKIRRMPDPEIQRLLALIGFRMFPKQFWFMFPHVFNLFPHPFLDHSKSTLPCFFNLAKARLDFAMSLMEGRLSMILRGDPFLHTLYTNHLSVPAMHI